MRSRCAPGAAARRCHRQAGHANRSACVTDMRFCVSVPVLSLQITVVEPSVSTAGRWRTSALRFAMRCVAIASDRVTVGSRPSGTLATMMPMANMRVGPERQAERGADSEEEQPQAAAKIATSGTIARSPAAGARLRFAAVCVRWAMLAELGAHAGRIHDRARLPGHQRCPGQQQVPRVQGLAARRCRRPSWPWPGTRR